MAESGEKKRPLLLELLHRGAADPVSQYMREALEAALPGFRGRLACRVVDLCSAGGKQRLLELSLALYGHDEVYQRARLAPTPCLAWENQLLCSHIADEDEMRAMLAGLLEQAK